MLYDCTSYLLYRSRRLANVSVDEMRLHGIIGKKSDTDLEDKVFAEEGTEVFQTQQMVFLPCS